MSVASRIDTALAWLASQFSATREEFYRAQHPGGPMLLQGCLSGGYLNTRDDRVSVSPLGLKRLEANREPAQDDGEGGV